MSSSPPTLVSAKELARRSDMRFPNESADYRKARTALLAEEIELRRHIERVAQLRRQLPPGGEVHGNYQFEGAGGSTDLAGLFRAQHTLVVYSYMFGPQRKRPCPMCTSLLGAWAGEARDIRQRVALAVVARAPIGRLLAFAQERGWRDLPLYSDINENYSRAYYALLDGDDIPALNVFTRRDGRIRHFWSGEMTAATADPGQDPRGAPDLMPLWTLLDATPEGRGEDWYPKLDY